MYPCVNVFTPSKTDREHLSAVDAVSASKGAVIKRQLAKEISSECHRQKSNNLYSRVTCLQAHVNEYYVMCWQHTSALGGSRRDWNLRELGSMCHGHKMASSTRGIK